MRVENAADRARMPKECDNCGSSVILERFYSYGPSHNVRWLCKYCCRDFTQGDNAIIKSIAAMLHKFEEDFKNGE